MKSMYKSIKATFTGSSSTSAPASDVKAPSADPKVLDEIGKALYSAADNGNATKVASLLQENPGINVNYQNETGRTPLIQASFHNHPAVVELLLKAGANVNIAENSNLSTALHWASYSGHPKVVKLLLDAGANKDLKEKSGDWTALKWAVHQKHTEVIALLEGRPVATVTASPTPAPPSPLPAPPVPPKTTTPLSSVQQNELGAKLFAAAESGQVAKVKELLSTPGIDINYRNDTGKTALIQAASQNEAAVAELLINAGAALDIAETTNNSTALHWSCYKGNVAITKMLLDKGANRNLVEKNGDWTGLKWAVNQKHTAVIALFEGKAGATATATAAHTPAPPSPLPAPAVPPETALLAAAQQKELGAKLFAAAESGMVAKVKELLSTPGIDINYRNDTGRTPLIQAASRNEAGTAELLINAGAALDIAETTNNSTALHWSCYNGNAAITKMLLDKGANMHLFEKTNWTALQWASNQGHVAVVILLLQAGVNVDGHPAGSRSALSMAKDDATRAAFATHTKKSNGTAASNPTTATSTNTTTTSNTAAPVKSEADKQAAGKELQTAARNSKLEDLNRLLSAPGADINYQDGNGATALHWAAYLGNHTAVAVLIKYKANLNLAEKSGATALTWASSKGHKEVLTMLLQAGADTQIKENGRTARDQAKDASIVQIFDAHAAKVPSPTPAPAPAPAPLPTPPAAVSKKNEVGKKLQMACRHKEMSTIQSMLSAADSDINYQDKDNAASAMHWAAYLGHTDVVKLLIERKANLDLTETTGATALHWASSEGHAEVVRLLLLGGANTSLLKHNRTARQQAKNADIEQIFANHANGTLFSSPQQPIAVPPAAPVVPAAVAVVVAPPAPPVINTVVASEEHVKQASAGCIYITDGDAAAEQSIKMSASEPATVSPVPASSYQNLNEVELGTALHGAASKCDLSKVRELLSTPGINIDFKYQNSETALIQACYEGHLPVAQLLVEKGANLNLRDGDGWTALHWAAYNGVIEIVQLLLSRCADATIESKKGKTALESCTRQDIKDMISKAL